MLTGTLLRTVCHTAKLLNEMVALYYRHSDRVGGDREGDYIHLCIQDMKRLYMKKKKSEYFILMKRVFSGTLNP